MRTRSMWMVSLGVLLLTRSAPGQGPAKAESEPVRVEFFVMSKCPFAAQVLTTIEPLLEKLGDHVRFSLGYIGKEQGGKLISMHGDSEVEGDKIWACAARHHPGRYTKLVACMSSATTQSIGNSSSRYRGLKHRPPEELSKIPGNFDVCADRLELPKEKIRACAQGDEGTGLLRRSFLQSAKRGARGSPTMYIGGRLYRGSRTARGFLRAICRAFPGRGPALCTDVPPPVRVRVVLLTDRRCTDCRDEMYTRRIQRLLPGAELDRVDYSSPRGKDLYARLGPKPILLPLLLLGKEVEQAEGYDRIRRHLSPGGEYLLFGLRGGFDPTREICDNGEDDTGDELVDCADPHCEHSPACRQEVPGKLEVFIMSKCPFAVRGLSSMKEVLGRFENDIRFEIHYIATVRGDGFQSLHGQQEVEENIRQLCAIKHYPEGHKFMDYIWCRNQTLRSSDWTPCTGQNDIDTATMRLCAQGGEGAGLLREDIRIAEGLRIRASPTWVVNGRHQFQGLDAKVIVDNFCAHNQNFWGCRQTKAEKAAPAEHPPRPDSSQTDPPQ